MVEQQRGAPRARVGVAHAEALLQVRHHVRLRRLVKRVAKPGARASAWPIRMGAWEPGARCYGAPCVLGGACARTSGGGAAQALLA